MPVGDHGWSTAMQRKVALIETFRAKRARMTSVTSSLPCHSPAMGVPNGNSWTTSSGQSRATGPTTDRHSRAAPDSDSHRQT